MLEIETGTDFSGMFPYTPSHKYVVGLCRSPRHIPVDAHIVFLIERQHNHGGML